MSDAKRDSDLERLLAAVPTPVARSEFRSSLRERFLAGSASAPAVDVLPEERSPTRQAGTGRSWKPWVALAAAAGILALLYLSKPAPRHWQVLPGSSATVVRVNGEALPAAETGQIATALNDARSVSAEGGSLRLSFRDQYAIELPEGARVEFASFGNTGSVDAYSLGSTGSALRIVTGPGFHGHELHVRSGVTSLLVTGTAFAVDNFPEGVCVCGLEGRIAIQRKGAADLPLEAGKQCWFPKDESALVWGEAHPPHIAPVRELEAAARAHWQP
jgi:ferric-dicitrate binding protein FerR (iron transport regulator)